MNQIENSEQNASSGGWAWSAARRQMYSIVGTTLLVLGFFIPWAEQSFGPTGSRFSTLLGTVVGRGEGSSVAGFSIDAGEISQHRGWLILWLGVAAGLMALANGDRIIRLLRPFRCTVLLIGPGLLVQLLLQITGEGGSIRTGFVMTLAAYGLLWFGLILDFIKRPD